MLRMVSIPFKRESPFGRPIKRPVLKKLAQMRFNSLQTGKSFRTQVEAQMAYLEYPFQFPSNGKVLSDEIRPDFSADYRCVSIPFQRESPFGRSLRRKIRLCVLVFQFPSNGKVLSDERGRRASGENCSLEFQFPSNGKVLSDRNPTYTLG